MATRKHPTAGARRTARKSARTGAATVARIARPAKARPVSPRGVFRCASPIATDILQAIDSENYELACLRTHCAVTDASHVELLWAILDKHDPIKTRGLSKRAPARKRTG